MNIFIWRGYGEIDVYPAETVEELAPLLKTIISCLDGWGMEADVEKINTYIAKEQNAIPAGYRKAINYLLDKAGIGSHEQFEYGTGFTKMSKA